MRSCGFLHKSDINQAFVRGMLVNQIEKPAAFYGEECSEHLSEIAKIARAQDLSLSVCLPLGTVCVSRV
jgi:hypothetical protein